MFENGFLLHLFREKASAQAPKIPWIRTYPQEGQNDVDRGGWIRAERITDGRRGTYLRYEFTSGKFQYLDELELMVDARGKVSVRTASRSAGFDYKVNATRLLKDWIQRALQRQGWEVTFVYRRNHTFRDSDHLCKKMRRQRLTNQLCRGTRTRTSLPS